MVKKLLFLSAVAASAYGFAQRAPSTGGPVEDLAVMQPTVQQVETFPEFPGGLTAFRSIITKNFDTTKIEGTGRFSTVATFVIEADGSMNEFQYTGDKRLGEELIRVLSSITTLWKPATNQGKAVKYHYKLPISMSFQ